MTVALIADIVSSRGAASRAELQLTVEHTVQSIDALRPWALQSWRPTFADEFQAVHAGLLQALDATYLIQLALPEGVACRFGLGVGSVEVVPSTTDQQLEDGPGWWAAREAINKAHSIADSDVPGARTWLAVHSSATQELPAPTVAAVNAYLLLRDQVISGLSERARSAEFGSIRGMHQQQIADRDGVSQSAVSQALSRPQLRALRAGAAEVLRGIAAD